MPMRVPVDGAASVGYTIRPSYDLPPLMFDREEVQAVAVGLQLLNRTGDGGSRGLRDGPVIKPDAAGIKVCRGPAWPWRQSEGLGDEVGDRRSPSSAQARSIGGSESADAAFHPSNGDVTQTIQAPGKPVFVAVHPQLRHIEGT